jgi:acyl-coenzyme A thioesterase PaaI-like protein
MSKPPVTDSPSEQSSAPEYAQLLRELFEEHIVFNRVMGLKISHIGDDRVRARIDMKPELIGHFLHGRMHGGVISACLDALGGMACMAAVGRRYNDEPPLQCLDRFEKLATIDLRVDYLRPAVSTHFDLHAEVLRLGSRVGNTRMEFYAADGLLVATGAGAYIVS